MQVPDTEGFIWLGPYWVIEVSKQIDQTQDIDFHRTHRWVTNKTIIALRSNHNLNILVLYFIAYVKATSKCSFLAWTNYWRLPAFLFLVMALWCADKCSQATNLIYGSSLERTSHIHIIIQPAVSSSST